jgi:hypothetical protein
MAFFNFYQNNSGGSFKIDAVRGISYVVVIEADSADEANERAEEIGLYFHGVQDGRDCDCCGDRWARASEHDAEDTPTEGYCDDEHYIHYKDGRIVLYVPTPRSYDEEDA